jgi:hypothetical protein
MSHFAPMVHGGSEVHRIWHVLLARSGFVPPPAKARAGQLHAPMF